MGVSPAENEHSWQKEMQTNSQIQGSFVGSTPLVLRELVLKPHRQSSGIRVGEVHWGLRQEKICMQAK